MNSQWKIFNITKGVYLNPFKFCGEKQHMSYYYGMAGFVTLLSNRWKDDEIVIASYNDPLYKDNKRMQEYMKKFMQFRTLSGLTEEEFAHYNLMLLADRIEVEYRYRDDNTFEDDSLELLLTEKNLTFYDKIRNMNLAFTKYMKDYSCVIYNNYREKYYEFVISNGEDMMSNQLISAIDEFLSFNGSWCGDSVGFIFNFTNKHQEYEYFSKIR